LVYHVELRQIIAYLDTISATIIQGTEDAICIEKTTDGLLYKGNREIASVYSIFPDCQAERLGGDIMLLSTLDKNHLSNLANLHHTISELLIG
jgi:ribosomal 50S subunit-associated protein YjgA (DUF615 family)